MSQSFYGFDDCRDWIGEEIFELTFSKLLNVRFESFVDCVSEVIFLFDPDNNPIIHFVYQYFKVADLLLRVGINKFFDIIDNEGNLIFLLFND